MTEFLITFITLSAVCSVALLISPDGSIKKYVSLACALCAVSFIAASVGFTAFDEIDLPKAEIEDKTDELKKIAAQQALYNIENSVKTAACEKYNINDLCIRVSVDADMSNYEKIKLSGIYITLYGMENAVKTTRLQQYIKNMFDCNTEVDFIEEGNAE